MKQASSGSVIIKNTETRFHCHIVAASTYYGYTGGWLGAVLVEIEKAQIGDSFVKDEVWLRSAKALAFVTAIQSGAEKEKCSCHKGAGCSARECSWSDKMTYVQWSKLLEKRTHLIDAIDSVLCCVELRWQQRV